MIESNRSQKCHELRISVVIPTLNEAQNLHYVLPFIPSIVNEVILVDGHSTDETITVAQQLLPDIRIIYQTGKGKGNEIPRFIEVPIAGNDYAKGSRFIAGGGSDDITLLRRLGNYALCTLVNMLFRTRFSDLCYGYNGFWKHCINNIEIDCNGFEVETLINLRIHKANLKIIEVPSFEHARMYGQSNLRTFRDGWRVLKTIVKERTREALIFPEPPPVSTPLKVSGELPQLE